MPFKLSEKERDENDNRKREIERGKKTTFAISIVYVHVKNASFQR